MASENHDVERLGAFTDGVLAISITLLVLDIRLPEGFGEISDAALWRQLVAIWPKYLGYIISFLVIGNYWIVHAAKFKALARIDGGFVWLNILFLLVVGAIPFVTSVISENSGALATSIYAATVALASLILAVMGWYAEARGLFKQVNLPKERLRHALMSLATTIVFGGSIVVAQFNADLARYTWLLLVPAGFLTRKHRTGPPDPLTG